MNAEDIALVAAILEDEEEDIEGAMLAVATVIAYEMAELEEGVGLDDLEGNSWVPITVNINEYHMMGNPCFRMHFRMSTVVFESLTGVIGNHLQQHNRMQRERTPLRDILLMVIWVLATPDSFRSVALRFGVRPSTLHYFYAYIIEALREMACQYIKWPSAEEREEIRGTFLRATGFPGVVGCIDGTHVPITAPLQHARQYINRHHSYSINVQATVDSTLLVRDLHVGEVGSVNDSRVFRRSPLHHDLLEEGDRYIQPDEHLLGDGAYILTDFMMIPFPNNGHRTPAQLNFNRRLSQGRVRVENAFGRAKCKWRRLKFLHARNQEYVVDYITAAFVLHNFIILNGEPMLEEEELEMPIHNNQVLGNGNFENDAEAVVELEHPLMAAAQGRGEEKRIFIMDQLLPLEVPE